MTRDEAVGKAAKALEDAGALLNTVGVPASEVDLYLRLADKYMDLANVIEPA